MNILPGLILLMGIAAFMLTVFRDIGMSMIFNSEAFMMVIGGTTIAAYIGFPVRRLRHVLRDVRESCSPQKSRGDTVRDLLEIARMYRTTDVRSIENRINTLDDPFLQVGVNLLINNHSEEEMRKSMEREMTHRIINSNFSQNVIKTIARLTPSFGLAGTVISLIKMFNHLDTIDSIAPMMAVALMSTFYGVIIANLFMMPLHAKIRERAVMHETSMYIVMEGILMIRNMEHPLRIEEKLGGFHTADEMIQGVPQLVPVNLMSNAGYQ